MSECMIRRWDQRQTGKQKLAPRDWSWIHVKCCSRGGWVLLCSAGPGQCAQPITTAPGPARALGRGSITHHKKTVCSYPKLLQPIQKQRQGGGLAASGTCPGRHRKGGQGVVPAWLSIENALAEKWDFLGFRLQVFRLIFGVLFVSLGSICFVIFVVGLVLEICFVALSTLLPGTPRKPMAQSGRRNIQALFFFSQKLLFREQSANLFLPNLPDHLSPKWIFRSL